MVKCSAPVCYNSTYKEYLGISFHRFPKDENIRNVWIRNVNRKDWQPNTSSVLCSKHFEAHLLDRSIFRPVLVAGAIPTIFKILQSLEENKENAPTLLVQSILHRKRTATGDLVLQDVQRYVPAAQGSQSVKPHTSVVSITLMVQPRTSLMHSSPLTPISFYIPHVDDALLLS